MRCPSALQIGHKVTVHFPSIGAERGIVFSCIRTYFGYVEQLRDEMVVANKLRHMSVRGTHSITTKTLEILAIFRHCVKFFGPMLLESLTMNRMCPAQPHTILCHGAHAI